MYRLLLRGILFTYRLPNNNDLRLFFEKTTQYANQVLSKYDNTIVTDDFYIDIGSKKCNKFKQFADFCHTIALVNLINVKHVLSRPRLSLLWTLF